MMEDSNIDLNKHVEPKRLTFLGSRALFYLLVAQTVDWVVLGVTKLVIGSTYVHDCDVQPLIPVWLILDAFIPLFFCGFWSHVKEDSSDSLKMKGYISICIGSFLSVIWCICGGIWIYPNWASQGQCNNTLRSFAFAMITVNWSTMSMWTQLVVRLACAMRAQKQYVMM